MTRAAAAPRPTDDARWRALVSGAGRTGRWIVAHDWTGSPLGPLRDWPQSLRTALVICLHSPTPAAIWWGPELVLLPNDGYLALPDPTGPQLPGRPGAAVWPDAVPALTGVLTAAEVTCRQEREVDSGGERRRLVFSSGPIVDAAGRPGGVFTTVTATVTPADRATDVAEATDVDEPAAARRPDATGTGTGIPAARRDLDPPVPHQHGGERRRALRQAEGLARLAGALSAAGSREAVTEVVTTVTPTLVGAAEVRVAVATAGALDLTVTGGSGPGRLAVADDAPLARAVRDGDDRGAARRALPAVARRRRRGARGVAGAVGRAGRRRGGPPHPARRGGGAVQPGVTSGRADRVGAGDGGVRRPAQRHPVHR